MIKIKRIAEYSTGINIPDTILLWRFSNPNILQERCKFNLYWQHAHIPVKLQTGNFQTLLSQGILLIAPDYASIRGYYFNHKVLTRYLISLDDGIYLFIVRVQDGPGLRHFIRSVVDYPHIIILSFWQHNKRRISNWNIPNILSAYLNDVSENCHL